ncbi:TlyA family RNA methyltransferase [Alsobacter sp. KACC 23698]|uniref:TlyA family RNA methyltransferase n=1 Tax=Alsobacter sp. KACC 23698 TaxID=3149229 RepID=A0AAU7JJM9_9HYPH
MSDARSLPTEPPAAPRRADLALVERGFFESRAKAQEAIAAGLVAVDGRPVRKPSETIPPGAAVTAEPPYPWVSRGGLKLAAALERFGYDPTGRACLDVGASTGGFSHVLLSAGARRVCAVDVGHGQLHRTVRDDPRVASLEGRDARTLAPEDLGEAPTLLTFDVSFISLRLVMPHVLALAASDAAMVALVKPQFEAGRAHVRKGLVKDPAIHRTVCDGARDLVASLGWRCDGVIPSPVAGGDGNLEFLIGARRGAFPAEPHHA